MLNKAGHNETAICKVVETFDFRSLREIPPQVEGAAGVGDGEVGAEGWSMGAEPDEGEGQEGELALEAEAAAWTIRAKLRLEKLHKDVLEQGERASWSAITSALRCLGLDPPDVAVCRSLGLMKGTWTVD
jgi:hypothetical protein